MKQLARLLLAVLPIAALVAFAGPAQATGTTCESIGAPEVPGASVLSVTSIERHDFTVPPGPFNPEPITDIPAFCEVVVTLTHPGVDDQVFVETWLPLDTWSGRFQGTGGGGYAAGVFDTALAFAVKAGYAAVSTDAGVDEDPLNPSKWALTDDGRVNRELLTNFSSRSLHDMTVAGKALTAQFYGRPADHSYWNGCSTGGRQGHMEAQRYPNDYDGIVATAPAINWPRWLMADQWPQIVMQQEGNFPTPCEFAAFNDAAVAACDLLDKVADGVIGDPTQCRYDPRELIGKKIVCEGQELTISRADAEVVAKIWDGPGLWYGLPRGTSFDWIAATVTAPDGTITGAPFGIADNWIKYFVQKDPAFDTSTITYRDFPRLFARSRAEFDRIIGTDDPDLSGFRAAGGKMLTWHGYADEVIFPGGTVNYRERVERVMGGPSRVDEFFRVFLAPGVGHCAGGPGPVPTDPLAAVVDWVERGVAPDTLPAATTNANGEQVTRDLCRYPLVSRYNGHGDPNSATSYRCARKF